MGRDGDFLPEGKVRCGGLAVVAVGLIPVWAVDAVGGIHGVSYAGRRWGRRRGILQASIDFSRVMSYHPSRTQTNVRTVALMQCRGSKHPFDPRRVHIVWQSTKIICLILGENPGEKRAD
jgi:hypothetical protein